VASHQNEDPAIAFKPTTWYPIALLLMVLNLIGGGFAVGQGEPLHAMGHGALALAFGAWARRLRRGSDGSALEIRQEALAALEAQVNELRQELSQMQERLDFAERQLAQGPESRRR
jgi:hypothetical protein